MMRPQYCRSTVRRIAVAVGVGAMTVAVSVAPAIAQTATEHSQVGLSGHAATINTWKLWTKQAMDAQGPGEDWWDTFGQVITVPSGKSRLDKFEFYMHGWTYPPFDPNYHLVMRGEVYAWDGAKATGQALWESTPRTIALSPDDGWHGVAFKVGGAALTPGAKYVLFTSIAKDYEQCTDQYSVGWADVNGKDYPGGEFVFQNNDGDESQWTTQAWQTVSGKDAAFKAWLS
jgi:hypothetical protein